MLEEYMSSVCLCVIDNIKEKSDKLFCSKQIEELAKYYQCGIKCGVDWLEPFVSHIKKDSFVINIVDYPKCDNCEMFLLPDGWYNNGQSNKLPFIERIKLLQDISRFLLKKNNPVSFYIAQSGTSFDEFSHITLEINNLTDYLAKTIGTYGLEDGVHIIINQKDD